MTETFLTRLKTDWVKIDWAKTSLMLALSLALLWIFAARVPVQAGQKAGIFIYGDSLAAGYGLKTEDGFAAQLQRALAAQQIESGIHNASQSGETSAGGLARLKWSLSDRQPDIAILELGANDALRALPPAETRHNLDQILAQLKARRITILLAGMMAPPNLGQDYVKKFNAIYPELAKKHKLVFYPFFLDGVAGKKELNLLDGKHPNARGVQRIVRGILPFVKQSLKKAKRKTKAGEP